MAAPFLVDIDLNLNQLLNAVLEQLAADPAVNTTGRIWYNTTTEQIKYYNGTAVKVLGSSAKFAGTIGDGVTTAIAVTHNLGTTDVLVQVFTTVAVPQLVRPEIDITSANVVTVTFKHAPAVGAYRVVVMG